MSARDYDTTRGTAVLESGDLGALVIAMRHMLAEGVPLDDNDAGALYILAVMAEKAWHRLDEALRPTPALQEEVAVDG